MNQALDMVSSERDTLSIDEGIHYLWTWREYRNRVFWTSMYRWGAASVALTVAPYLLPDVIAKLQFAVLVFPVLAALLAIIAAYLMAVQYLLYKQVDRKYRSVLGKYNPEDIASDKPINRIFRISIGKIVSMLFLFFAFVGQFINALVLLWLLRGQP